MQPASGRGPVRSLVGESVSLSLQGSGIIKRNDYNASIQDRLLDICVVWLNKIIAVWQLRT